MSLIFQYRDAVSQVERLQADVDELRRGNSWLKQQRDELLAALHEVRLKTDPKYGWPIIDAAIAKVKPC